MLTLREAIDALKRRHIEYIESTYHVRHPQIILERRRLLEQSGGVATLPWIEATPTYETGPRLADMAIPREVRELLERMHVEGLGVFDPMFAHQTRALEAYFRDKKDLVVSTGTGSGKTEIFLSCILGAFAQEGARAKSSSLRGFRAIILYPMNALVSDQLSRLRRTLGDERSATVLQKAFGRVVQFGMYTSRTPYHGIYEPDKNDRFVRPIAKYYANMERQPGRVNLLAALRERGRIPQKNLAGFLGDRNDARVSKYRTQKGDRELLTRQEMHSPNENGGTPDVLITNYSMLEYMLLRPIEQPLFEDTRRWLESDPANQLLLVIDEAHLYRGAQGAEVALLLRRLLQHLSVPRERVRCVLTSASLGGKERAEDTGRVFASQLTGGKQEDFAVIFGGRITLGGKPPLSEQLGRALQSVGSDLSPATLEPTATYFGWPTPLPSDEKTLRALIGKELPKTAEFRALHDCLSERPRLVGEAGSELFPTLPPVEQVAATLNFALIATAGQLSNESPLLPVRVHVMFRGLPRLYTCINRMCPGRRVPGPHDLLGALYTSPHLTCEQCKSRVFELMGHRTCGAIYLRGYGSPNDTTYPRFLWTQDEAGALTEVHLLLEEPRSDPDPTEEGHHLPLARRVSPKYLDTQTGFLLDAEPVGGSGRYLRCWWPPVRAAKSKGRKKGASSPPAGQPDELSGPLTWTRCYACGIEERSAKGPSRIMDHETRGEEPFANLVKTMFMVQPPGREIPPDMETLLPNRGRKVLCFSDGRQKAARLARDLQRTVEQDSFRELVMLAAQHAGANAPLNALFANLVVLTRRTHIGLFDDGDGREAAEYPGSRTRFLEAQADIPTVMRDLGYTAESALLADEWARREINSKKPRQYDQQLLRVLGDRNFSIRQSMVGYLAPTAGTLSLIQDLNSPTDRELVRNIILAVIDYALQERALDPDIHEEDRVRSRRSVGIPQGYPRGGGEGFTGDDLLPDEIRDALEGIDPEATQRLRVSFRRGGPKREEPLFLPKDGRYWLNPAAVTLRIQAGGDWKRCRGCGRFTPFAFAGRCPDYKCQGPVVDVLQDDLYVRTRKDYLRNPILEVLGLGRPQRAPFTIRSEEHSAQLTTRDSGTVFGRAERYELLFQDILVDDLENQQPVDVLSCTTTMEVGIDIGSLIAVALRTVPPRPDNYQQRSGRAGRRGSAISMIATFADNSPYESNIFEAPSRIIGVDASAPAVYVQNLKIAERHLNAALIQSFIQRKTGGSADDDARKSSIFESLGTAKAFFVEDGPYSLRAFEVWAHEEIEPDRLRIAGRIGQVIPPEVARNLSYGAEPNWRQRMVTQTCRELVARLKEHGKRVNWGLSRDEDDNLLSHLLDAGFLPTFGFPLDLCAFVVHDFDRNRAVGRPGAIVDRYVMTQDLSQALSEYIPGREIVVDKHTFVSYGVYFPYPSDPVNRARVVDWDHLPWLNHCRLCGITLEESVENLHWKGVKCPREHEIESVPRYRPEGFAPEVDQHHGAIEGGERSRERLYAALAEFPVPVEPSPPKGSAVLSVSNVAQVRSLPNQLLVVRNFGPSQEGFAVCRDCGAVSLDGELGSPHNRPYQVESWHLRGTRIGQCNGPQVTVAFTHEFRTDLAILSVKARAPLKFAFNQDWFKAAARSLSEAFVLGATRILEIDPAELAGNWRVVAKYLGDPQTIAGHFEFFLYDTTPGGAGFAAAAAGRFGAVLGEARTILTNCECETSCHKCIRTYDNRVYHDSLTRHGALTLLDYAETGAIPELAEDVTIDLLKQVERALHLVDESITVDNASRSVLRLRRGARQIRVSLASVFSEITPPMTPGSTSDLPFTDYDVAHRLPSVVGGITDALRS